MTIIAKHDSEHLPGHIVEDKTDLDLRSLGTLGTYEAL